MTAMRLHRYPSPSGGIALGKMGVGATLMSAAKTTRDYVQDGLIAMWDGIENAGRGVHDPNATVWKDLVSGTVSESFQPTETVEDNAVVTTSRRLVLIDDVEPLANTTDTLTVQRVAQEIVQGTSNNAAAAVQFCGKKFGSFMYFRHVPTFSDNGYGCGPMGYSFSPHYGCFGKGFYNPNDTYPLQSRTMIAGANNNPIAAYEGTHQLSAWGQGLLWGSADDGVSANIAPVTGGGKIRNCAIRIYSRALTAAEIAANYAIDKERFNLP